MEDSVSEYCHDHVILRLDTAEFENPPAWLSGNFTIIEGGTHAGGSSRNKLIVFADGTYIELFNWIKEPKEFFDWATKAPGLIDFALTTPQSAHETHQSVTRRLETNAGHLGVSFKAPLFGGRQRKDGQQVQWYVTKPAFDDGDTGEGPQPDMDYFPTGRLDTPFYCHDVTDRRLRVPYADPTISTHPCGARGILAVEVIVPKERLGSYEKLYSAATGAAPTGRGGDRSSPTPSVHFSLSVANPEEEAMQKMKGQVGVEIRSPRNMDDEAWVRERGIGIRAVRLLVPGESAGSQDERALDTTGIGASIVLVRQPAHP